MSIPAQYLLAISGGGGTPAVKHTLTVTVTNGSNIVTAVKEGAKKTVTVIPNQDYLPPKTITTTQTIEYNKYTGVLSTVMGTSDISMSATCPQIPHSNDAIKTFPLTHAEMASYKLTHNKLAGVY